MAEQIITKTDPFLVDQLNIVLVGMRDLVQLVVKEKKIVEIQIHHHHIKLWWRYALEITDNHIIKIIGGGKEREEM